MNKHRKNLKKKTSRGRKEQEMIKETILKNELYIKAEKAAARWDLGTVYKIMNRNMGTFKTTTTS